MTADFSALNGTPRYLKDFCAFRVPFSPTDLKEEVKALKARLEGVTWMYMGLPYTSSVTILTPSPEIEGFCLASDGVPLQLSPDTVTPESLQRCIELSRDLPGRHYVSVGGRLNCNIEAEFQDFNSRLIGFSLHVRSSDHVEIEIDLGNLPSAGARYGTEFVLDALKLRDSYCIEYNDKRYDIKGSSPAHTVDVTGNHRDFGPMKYYLKGLSWDNQAVAEFSINALSFLESQGFSLFLLIPVEAYSGTRITLDDFSQSWITTWMTFDSPLFKQSGIDWMLESPIEKRIPLTDTPYGKLDSIKPHIEIVHAKSGVFLEFQGLSASDEFQKLLTHYKDVAQVWDGPPHLRFC